MEERPPKAKPSSELLREWCAITLEPVERHELATVGPPMTGLAERFVAELFDGTVARAGQRDWDVQAAEGLIQVKALWDVGRRTRHRLGRVGVGLDLLVAVIFDASGRIAEVWQVRNEPLKELRGDAERVIVRLPRVRRKGRAWQRPASVLQPKPCTSRWHPGPDPSLA